MVSDVVVRYARALQNSRGSNVETLYKLMDGKAEALEFNVCKDAPILNKPLKDLNLKKNILIIGISRGGELITPSGLTEIHEGDRVVIITTTQGYGDIGEILAKDHTKTQNTEINNK
jgi:trk system potassium uptake protein TrkA